MVTLRNKKPSTRRTLFIPVSILSKSYLGVGESPNSKLTQNIHICLQRLSLLYTKCFILGRSSWVFIPPIKQSRIRQILEGLSWQWFLQNLLWKKTPLCTMYLLKPNMMLNTPDHMAMLSNLCIKTKSSHIIHQRKTFQSNERSTSAKETNHGRSNAGFQSGSGSQTVAANLN